MTDAQTQNVDTKLDARIFGLILKGQLTETSSIADGAGGPAILLADHPRFSKVLQLTRMGRSVMLLKDAAFWAHREATWQADLTETPFWRLLFRVFSEHATGFLTLEGGGAAADQSKVIAFSAGVPLTINSTIRREQLGSLMLREKLITREQAEVTAALCQEKAQPLGWALLEQGLLPADEIIAVLERQARLRLLQLFTWRQGRAAFHVDDRAAQLHGVVNLPLLTALRRGFFAGITPDADTLRSLVAPLIESDAPLALVRPLGTLEFFLEGLEGAVVAAARDNKTTLELCAKLESEKDTGLVEGLRALYMFVQVDVIGLLDGETPPLPLVATLLAPTPREPDHMADIAAGIAAHTGADARELLSARDTASATPDAVDTAAAMGGSAGKAKLAGASQLDEYRLQMQLEQEGRRLLNSDQPDLAQQKFQQLVDRQERPVDALGFLAIATLLAKLPGGRDKALRHAKRAVETDEDSAIARAALSKALAAHGKHRAAEAQRKLAMSLSQHNSTYHNEIIGLLDLGTPVAEQQPKVRTRVVDTNQVVSWIIVGVVVLLLFALANLAGFGKREYFYDPHDGFFFFRRGLLLVAGLVGLGLHVHEGGRALLRELGWGFDRGTVLLAVVLGLVVGYLSPPQRVSSGLVVVSLLTLLHVAAEEVFFRGFVTRFLLDTLAEKSGAIALSAAIFGIYHLTYYSFWYETALVPKLYWVAAIALFAGFPYAALYARRRSLLPPLVCHGVVNLLMMWLSVTGH